MSIDPRRPPGPNKGGGMSENPFAPYNKPFEALRAVVRFGPALVENPSDILPLLFVAERTASWQKAADAVSLRQFVEGIRRRDGKAVRSGCGLQLTALKEALARLEKRGLLVRQRRSSKRGADVPTEYRIDWKRFAEMIESVPIPVAVKRPPPGRVATTLVAVKRPHSKDSYSKDLNSKPPSLPTCSNVTAQTAVLPVTAGRLAGLLKLLTECWPHLTGGPGPKLISRIAETLADTPLEPFAESLVARRADVRSYGLALELARDLRKRWESDAAEPSTPATARKPPQSSLVERTKAMWKKRIAEGERPL